MRFSSASQKNFFYMIVFFVLWSANSDTDRKLLLFFLFFFFFNDTATTEIYTLSLHDALPILCIHHCRSPRQWLAEEVAFVQQIAQQVEVAIQQAKLLQEMAIRARREQIGRAHV